MYMNQIFTYEEGWESEFSHVFNNMFFDKEKHLKEVMADANATEHLKTVAAIWLHALCWQNEKHFYDDRNSASVKRGVEISRTPEGQRIMGTVPNATENLEVFGRNPYGYMAEKIQVSSPEDFRPVFKMITMHRTIQQTFSRFVFFFLKNTTNLNLGKRWDELPLI